MTGLWEGFLGAVVAAIVTALAAIFKPWSDDAKLKRKQKKIMSLFVTGDPGTKGLIEEILPAPERMLTVEQTCAEHELKFIEQDDRFAKDEKTLWEHGETLTKVKRGVENLTREFAEYRRANERNGGDGPGFGDTLHRIAEALGVDVPGIKEVPHE